MKMATSSLAWAMLAIKFSAPYTTDIGLRMSMSFNDNLATFPAVEHLSGLNVLNEAGEVLHHIPAVAGKLGSLKLYNALAERFDGLLNAEAAAQGLTWFAEHVADAEANPGKHPNVDLLLTVQADQKNYRLQAIAA
jgi:hypothetical protein